MRAPPSYTRTIARLSNHTFVSQPVCSLTRTTIATLPSTLHTTRLSASHIAQFKTRCDHERSLSRRNSEYQQQPTTSSFKSTPISNKQEIKYSSIGQALVTNAMKNGILETDDYFRYGIPKPKYHLDRASQSLNAIFKRHEHVDPFTQVANDLRSISESIRDVVGSDHPVLERIASYFFEIKGKRIRPTLVLLVSQAACKDTAILPSQKRLSEITEMIHTASLLHDDVIDEAETRRGVKSINALFGNKLAILGGDFLLARASLALAKLRNPDVIELLSVVIEHLVKGEVMQMKSSDSAQLFDNVDYYLTKTFYKTASLMANSCKATAILGGHNSEVQEIAFEYGKHLGLAFQIIDDLLDFVGSAKNLGKPTMNDLGQGIPTLPVYYAAQEFPELREMIARKFKQVGDVEKALGFVERSNSIEKARQLAIKCGETAVAAIQHLPPSPAQSALINLVQKVLNRDH